MAVARIAGGGAAGGGGRRKVASTVKLAPQPAPQPAPAPAPAPQHYSAPSYSPPPSYSEPYIQPQSAVQALAAAPAPAPAPAMSQDQFIASDAGYQAQLAALTKALSNYQADNTAQVSKYNTDFGTSLKNLGWNPAAAGAVDDPSTPNIDESKGGWNTTDTNTASGRAYENQMNDFASRGLLQSSLYGEANNNLMRSLSDQLSGLNTGKQNFMDNLTSQLTAYKDQNLAQQQQAKADALARYAVQFGI